MSGNREPRSLRPAQVRYYIDADILGLAHVLASVRADVTYPGDPGGPTRRRTHRPPCPIIDPGTKDEVWIPLVARSGWTVITRDRNIERRPAEIQAVLDNDAKHIVIASREELNLWHQLEIVLSRWRDIERFSAEPGPFIYAITRASTRKIR